MVGIIALLGAVAAQQPEVGIALDRSEVLVGERVVLTITVRTVGSTAVDLVTPFPDGFEVLDVRDRSSVRVRDGASLRETVRQVTLRAQRAGRFAVGPVEVRLGDAVGRSDMVHVRVRPRGSGAALTSRLHPVVERAAAPALGEDEVGLTVVLAPDSAVVGAQLDVLVIAWFPRGVREQLRNPPTLQPPQVAGAWVYHQHVPSRPALTRTERGQTYDLYVLHDAIFPLRPGVVEIGAATVTFALPLSQSFLGREARHEIRSAPLWLEVRPLPAAPGDPSAGVPVAAGLQWLVTLPRGELALGGAATAEIVLAGRGNVALWPEPEVRWPVGLRVYPEAASSQVTAEDGLIGGTKVYRYLVVADAAGRHRVPGPVYPYFDTDSGAFRALAAEPVDVATPAALQPPRVSRAGALPLGGAGDRVPLAIRLARRTGAPSRIAILLLPPLIAVGAWVVRLRPRTLRRAPPAGQQPALDRLAAQFRRALEALVPDQAWREGDGLADALRAAGVEEPVAHHAARVRDRLRQAVFGPGGATDADELNAEVQEVLRVLVGEAGRARPAAPEPSAMLLLLLLLGASGTAHAQDPARLYAAGAYRVAADSFARRAAERPDVPRHWYQLGAALYQLDERTAARAAWVRAARLVPRDRVVRGQLSRVPAPDDESRRLTWVAPITAAEALVVGAALWVVGWLALAARRRAAGLALIFLAGPAAGYGAFVSARYAQPVGLIARADVSLREAPFGSAAVRDGLQEGAAVRVERVRGAWLLVRRGGRRGWIRVDQVVRL